MLVSLLLVILLLIPTVIQSVPSAYIPTLFIIFASYTLSLDRHVRGRYDE